MIRAAGALAATWARIQWLKYRDRPSDGWLSAVLIFAATGAAIVVLAVGMVLLGILGGMS